MQKWEYLVVQLEYGTFRRSAGAKAINNQELRDWKKTPLHTILNQLGADGWKLVGAIGYPPSNNDNELLFKRPTP